MSGETAEIDRLTRENAYLKARCAQLQADATDLEGEVRRLQERLERLLTPRGSHAPDPLSGGQ